MTLHTKIYPDINETRRLLKGFGRFWNEYKQYDLNFSCLPSKVGSFTLKKRHPLVHETGETTLRSKHWSDPIRSNHKELYQGVALVDP